MITFTKAQDNKQYIIISTADSKTAPEVYDYIKGIYSSLNNLPCIIDDEEVAIEICDNQSVGFSLNELRQQVQKVSDAVINVICVDLSVDGQRIY